MATHKKQLNKHYGFNLDKSHSISQLSRLTKIPVSILKEVYKRGEGAWSTNIKSVRTKKTFRKNQNLPRNEKLSSSQWAMARVYAFINKLLKGSNLNHDRDLALKIPNIKIRIIFI